MYIYIYTYIYIYAGAWKKGHIIIFFNIELLGPQDAAYSNQENEKNALKNSIFN